MRRQEELDLESAELIYPTFMQLDVVNPNDGSKECYCCGKPPTGRSSMNIWGTIVDFQTCDECHIAHDMKWADALPKRDNG